MESSSRSVGDSLESGVCTVDAGRRGGKVAVTAPWPPAARRLAPSLGRPVGITGVGSHVPDRVLTNFDLAKIVDTSDEWIVTRTGISERRIAGEDEATSDLAVGAARRALEHAGVAAADVDLIIVATVSPDTAFPAVASLVQTAVGASNAGAFDLAAGCSGFIYALATGAQFVATGFFDRVLVVGADCLSRLVNWRDRSTCVLFGDGAGAVMLEPAPDGFGCLSFDLGSDGAGARLLCVEGGGSRRFAPEASVDHIENTIRMVGSEVFKFAVRAIEGSTRRALTRAQLSVPDIDLFIAHQANLRIIGAAAKRLELPDEKVFTNVHKYGNTSAASIPIALCDAFFLGKLHRGDTLAMCGFGSGLTWASCILQWSL
jgi:3-oxoacyl-[acyl-carrier-protein] synthase III